MTTATVSEKLKGLALDLTKEFPRSPRALIGGYVLAGRMLDKCRASLAGTNGEYHFDCPLDNIFFGFSGVNANELKDYVATGASDEEVGEFIKKNAKQKSREEVIQWNNDWRCKTMNTLDIKLQTYMEDYIPECLPEGIWPALFFDIYDIEEKRMTVK